MKFQNTLKMVYFKQVKLIWPYLNFWILMSNYLMFNNLLQNTLSNKLINHKNHSKFLIHEQWTNNCSGSVIICI